MYYYRVTIAYKGTQYIGWQAQSQNTLHEERPTIEGTILNVLKKIVNYQVCTISAASRTDAGVHAQGQLAKISLPKEITPEHLLMGLNSMLSSDIRILTCTASTKKYQPTRTSVSKEYHYYFITSPVGNVATSDIALHLPLGDQEVETLILLRHACQLFVGQHDFYNFCSRDTSAKTSIREISFCDICEVMPSSLLGNMSYLKIIGNGFLKHMVRYIMGALVDLAKGRITLDDISLYLGQHQDKKLSSKAQPTGLHLMHIEESE